MINSKLDLTRKTVTYSQTKHNREYSRIICAAVVNKTFRKQLLSDPIQAVKYGYCGETFHLREEEKRHIDMIQATNLADFAAQLLCVPQPVPVAIPVSAY